MTVQQVIEEQLSILLQKDTAILGCGRTDTGVHAREYYFHFDTENAIDEQTITYKLNHMVGDEICIYTIFMVKDGDHARFSASLRSYYYHLSLSKDPFLIGRSWILPYYQLDVDLMQQAAIDLLDYSDFPMFCKTGSDVNNYICKLSESKLVYNKEKQTLEYFIDSNRFLRTMIRRIMGTLVAVGKGQLSLEAFNKTLKDKTNFRYIHLAPPDGLYLNKVLYPFTAEKEYE